MIIVTREDIFINPIKNKINTIINNTALEHDEKCGDNFCKKN